MAPTTMTETELIHPITTDDLIEYNLSHNLKDHDNRLDGKPEKSPYDQMLKEEPKYMAPIRSWEKRIGFVTPLRWMNVVMITFIHIIAVIWAVNLVIISEQPPKMPTVMFGVLVGILAGFGVTGGAHRYWCHRSFKAKLPLQWFLVFCFSIAGQNTIFEWVRDHRVHHKFSETSADPHNANRGFFFAHVGWLMMKKHPDVVKQGDKLDMSDITNDPLVQFHTKYFILFKIALCWVIPSLIPVYCWGECWGAAICSQAVERYVLSLNFTWAVNSFAHMWGNKPYDRHIMPVENWGVSAVAMGEGWHNYHHSFPWDYKASELGMPLNLTTTFLNYFASIGWAYDLKVASPALVRAVAKSRGEPQDD